MLCASALLSGGMVSDCLLKKSPRGYFWKKGSSTGLAMFRCITDEGNEFESTPEATMDERRQMLKDRNKYIGKWAKVRYHERSGKNNVPFHSNMLEVRETKTGGY
jgi:hypothetical protein